MFALNTQEPLHPSLMDLWEAAAFLGAVILFAAFYSWIGSLKRGGDPPPDVEEDDDEPEVIP